MSIDKIPSSLSSASSVPSSKSNGNYVIKENKEQYLNVHPDLYDEAKEIDVNGDFILTEDELKVHLRNREILRNPNTAQVDEESILRDYKLTLQNVPLPQTAVYKSYEEVVQHMRDLAEQYPDKAEMVFLTETPEGRGVWALKVGDVKKPSEPDEDDSWILSSHKSESTGNKELDGERPGIVITGAHHAREWISVEVPLFAAEQILKNVDSDEAMKQRTEKSTIWFVPLVNPDGFEYSRNKNFWWRKNRQPITETAGDLQGNNAIKGYGIDLSRNYLDDNPEHYTIYRPEGDSPTSTWDDYGASDRISSDTYRGPAGAYAPEVKALQDLLKNNDIKAAIDFHSYGRMILFPWGHNYDKAENRDEYLHVAGNMAKIIKESDKDAVSYKVMQSSDLYPATGTSEDFHHVNDILSFTVELGRSFAPDQKEIDPIRKRLLGAQLYLIDYIIDKHSSPEKPELSRVFESV